MQGLELAALIKTKAALPGWAVTLLGSVAQGCALILLPGCFAITGEKADKSFTCHAICNGPCEHRCEAIVDITTDAKHIYPKP